MRLSVPPYCYGKAYLLAGEECLKESYLETVLAGGLASRTQYAYTDASCSLCTTTAYWCAVWQTECMSTRGPCNRSTLC